MNKTYFFLLIIVLTFSCKQNEKPQINSKTQIIKPNAFDKEEELYIIKDSLTNVWVHQILDYSEHPKITFSTNHKLIVNTHNKSIIDTLSTYTFKESKIDIYKAKERKILTSAVLQNEELILSDFITIGLKKYTMEKYFATGIPNDTLKIGVLEGTNVFNFIFKNGELKTIVYQGYFD